MKDKGRGIYEYMDDGALELVAESRKELRRRKLGTPWTQALAELDSLIVDYGKMTALEKKEVEDQYINVNDFGKDPRLKTIIKPFFDNPSLANFEGIMSLLPVIHNDADNLKKEVAQIRTFMK